MHFQDYYTLFSLGFELSTQHLKRASISVVLEEEKWVQHQNNVHYLYTQWCEILERHTLLLLFDETSANPKKKKVEMSIHCFKFQSCRVVRVEGRRWLHYADAFWLNINKFYQERGRRRRRRKMRVMLFSCDTVSCFAISYSNSLLLYHFK